MNIYKIRSKIGNCCYIGSTSLNLSSRFSTHKSQYKLYNAGRASYVSSFEVVKFPDAKIKLVEVIDGDRAEVLKREGVIIAGTPTAVNKNRAGATLFGDYHKRYYQANKAKFQEYCKNYYQNKKVVIQCDCGGKYVLQNLKNHCATHKHQKYVVENSNVI